MRTVNEDWKRDLGRGELKYEDLEIYDGNSKMFPVRRRSDPIRSDPIASDDWNDIPLVLTAPTS